MSLVLTQEVNIDLSNNYIETIYANQEDNLGRNICCNFLLDGTKWQIPSGVSVYVKAHKNNGKNIYRKIGVDNFGTIDGNKVIFPVIKAMTVSEGRVQFTIEFTENDIVLHSSMFYLKVNKIAFGEDAIIDSDDYHVLIDYTNEAEQYMNSAKQYSENASAYANNAKTSENNAKISETNAKESSEYASSCAINSLNSANSASDYASDANTSASNAKESELNAKTYSEQASSEKDLAESYAKRAQSYSDGTSGTRTNEETDNAKYYSEQAKNVATSIPTYIKQIEDAGNSQISRINDAIGEVATTFTVDFSTGHLLYTGSKFSFNINDNGHLEWEVI